jgi:membrane-associated phospholipid phosphatase
MTMTGALSHDAAVAVGRFLWGAGVFAGACAVGVAVTTRPAVAEVDRAVFEAMNAGHGPQADRVFDAVTELGSLYAAGAAGLTLAALGRRREAVRALGAAGATWLLLQAMKKVVDRPRPSDVAPGTRQLIARPNGQSWPSSHPAVLTAFSRVAAREAGVDAVGRTALGTLDAAVAASRVYLGVHYPSDVVSGLLIGRTVARWWPRGARATGS